LISHHLRLLIWWLTIPFDKLLPTHCLSLLLPVNYIRLAVITITRLLPGLSMHLGWELLANPLPRLSHLLRIEFSLDQCILLLLHALSPQMSRCAR